LVKTNSGVCNSQLENSQTSLKTYSMVIKPPVLGFAHSRFLLKANWDNSFSERVTMKDFWPFIVSHLEKSKDLKPKSSVKKEAQKKKKRGSNGSFPPYFLSQLLNKLFLSEIGQKTGQVWFTYFVFKVLTKSIISLNGLHVMTGL
jgi:hypothetical protein